MPLSFLLANILEDLCLAPTSNMPCQKASVHTSVNAARRSACATKLLGSYFDGQTLSHSVAGVVLGDQFVIGVSQRRNLDAMADGRMKLLYRRLYAHSLGCVHAIADTGVPATADRSGSGVEVQNLELVASQ